MASFFGTGSGNTAVSVLAVKLINFQPLLNFLELWNDNVLKHGNRTANISARNCSLFIILTATDEKPQIMKGDVTH